LPEGNLKRKRQERTRSGEKCLNHNLILEMKNVIYNMYKDKEVPTVDAIKKKLVAKGFPVNYSNETLRKILHKIGFTFKKLNKRCAIMETPRLLTWRTEYIPTIQKNRAENRKIVFLDETWFDTHDVITRGWVEDASKCKLDTPPCRGKRIIILNAGNENGWVPGCLLLSAKNIKDSSADYHCDMDHTLFENWFTNTLIPNLPENSVIVLDNASYHPRQINKLPTKSSRKGDIQKFMEANNLKIPTGKATKADLLKIIADSEVNKEKSITLTQSPNKMDMLFLGCHHIIAY
jgi:hypothetical protein